MNRTVHACGVKRQTSCGTNAVECCSVVNTTMNNGCRKRRGMTSTVQYVCASQGLLSLKTVRRESRKPKN